MPVAAFCRGVGDRAEREKMPIAVDERRLCFPDLKHARGRRIHGNAPSTDLASDVGEDVSRDIKLIDGKGPR